MDKTLDSKGRWGSVTVGFRMSPEENSDLDTRVRLSGLTKQDYIIKRLQEKDIVVVGNPRVYKALSDQLAAVLAELGRIGIGEPIGDELLDTIKLITVTMGGMKEESDDHE